VRVVGGAWRGRRLLNPAARGIRPTMDRVRQAIFDMLEARALLRGALVLDLFAGTGAMGIEALSRGASAAEFVEADRRAARGIEANLEALDVAGIGASAAVVVARAEEFVAKAKEAGEHFDLAFVDPPYAWDRWESLMAQLPARWAVVETGRPLPDIAGWEEMARKRFGATLVYLMRRLEELPEPDNADASCQQVRSLRGGGSG
jgi:16S rRNA (guanine966-N2)-methyltransferase